MRRILTISMCAIGVMALGVSANAQKPSQSPGAKVQGAPPRGMDGHRMGGPGRMMFLKELNLTPAQETKIRAIMENQRKQMDAVRKQYGLPEFHREGPGQPPKNHPAQPPKMDAKKGAAVMAKMKAIHESTMKQVRAVLTAAQRAKFDKMMAERKQHMQAPPPGIRKKVG